MGSLQKRGWGRKGTGMIQRLWDSNSREPVYPWTYGGHMRDCYCRKKRGKYWIGQPSHCRTRARQGGSRGEKHLNLPLPLPSNLLTWSSHTRSQRAREPADTAHMSQLPESNHRWRRIKRIRKGMQKCPEQKALSLTLSLHPYSSPAR